MSVSNDALTLAAVLRDLLRDGAPISLPADAERNRSALAELLDHYERLREAAGASECATCADLGRQVAILRPYAAKGARFALGAQAAGRRTRKRGSFVGDPDSPGAQRERGRRAAKSAALTEEARAVLAMCGAAEEK